MDIIGFSTGALYKTELDFNKLIKIYKNAGVNALEIMCGEPELTWINRINLSDLKNFKHISFHAPVKNIKYGNNKKGENILNEIEKAHKKINFKCVVIHPDLVENWKIFKNYSFPLAVENMDWRKNFGRNIKDIQKIIKNINCKLVLDINHCFTNDSTLKLAQKFYGKFKNNICEIHISGFTKHHEPLFLNNQKIFLKLAPKIKKYPIIIESVCKDKGEAMRELHYIKKQLYA